MKVWISPRNSPIASSTGVKSESIDVYALSETGPRAFSIPGLASCAERCHFGSWGVEGLVDAVTRARRACTTR